MDEYKQIEAPVEEGITLAELVRIVWNNITIVFLTTLWVTVIGVVYTFVIVNPKYTAETTLMVQVDISATVTNEQSAITVAQNLIATYKAFVVSDKVLNTLKDDIPALADRSLDFAQECRFRDDDDFRSHHLYRSHRREPRPRRRDRQSARREFDRDRQRAGRRRNRNPRTALHPACQQAPHPRRRRRTGDRLLSEQSAERRHLLPHRRHPLAWHHLRQGTLQQQVPKHRGYGKIPEHQRDRRRARLDQGTEAGGLDGIFRI
ncbi:MAG: Wzz/FepE/Etk N-terminal domain-containing protein [Candidatus Moduliflexus flocculans]|nr:Wzz/FepE/Etk N-terminal domain-containing protein [Candidatus Moduliflexus flocculans]